MKSRTWMTRVLAFLLVLCMAAGMTPAYAVSENLDNYQMSIRSGEAAAAADFSIPEEMSGYVDTILWLSVYSESAVSTEITCSDPTVVDVNWGAAGNEYGLRLLKPGKATVTVYLTDDPSVFRTCEVTVKEPETFVAGETKNIYMDPYQTVIYEFTPTEDGSYTLYTLNDYEEYRVDFNIDGVIRAMWDQNGYRGLAAMDLKAGTTYTWEMWSYNRHVELPLTLAKAEPMTGLTLLQKEMTGFEGTEVTINAEITPALGVDRMVEWYSSDNAVAWVNATSLTSCNVYLQKVGEAEITASWVDDKGQTRTATCKVTAKEPEALVLNEVKTVSLKAGESATYGFTADSNGGEYLVKIGAGQNFRFEYGGNYDHLTEYYTEEFCGTVFELYPDNRMTLTISGDNAPLNTTLVVEKAVRATDVVLSTGDTLKVNTDEEVRVSCELVDGNYLSNAYAYSSDRDVAEVWRDNDNAFIVVGRNPGTATVTLNTQYFSKTLEVTVTEYGEDIPHKWVGTMEEPSPLEFEFTPDADGFYYFHYTDMDRIIPLEGGALPLSDFDYDDGRFHGVVYQLVGGQTYRFGTEWEVYGDYAVYVIPVQEATGFTIPATMSGPVDDVQWLEVSYTGVMHPEFVSTNEDVVRLGGRNAHGITVLLIAEGTADIIVTDHNGNEQRCTVTVSGKKPMEVFDGWREMGLAAGNSVTYSYTPDESGLYWICSELNYDLGISLTENGAEVACEFDYDRDDRKGKVYELTGGTQYLLTFSSDVSMSTFVNADRAGLASWLYLDSGEHMNVMEGQESRIWYWLDSDMFMPVADMSAKSSDESVVKILSCSGSYTSFRAVGEGEAQITITANGVEYGPVTVNVAGLGTIELDVPVNVHVNGNGVAYYLFQPQESGNYIVHQPHGENTFGLAFEGAENANWEGEGRFGTIAYNLEAGESYYVIVENFFAEDCSGFVTVSKSQQTTGISLGVDELSAFVGNEEWFVVHYIPDLGADSKIDWSVSDPEILEITEAFGGQCWIRYKKAGTAVLTATAENDSSITDSCTIIVEEMPLMEVDRVVEFDIGLDESIYYTFTPETSGTYVFSLPRNSMTDVWIMERESYEHPYSEWRYNPEYDNFYFELEGGMTYALGIYWYGSEDAPAMTHFQAVMHKAVEPTDLTVEPMPNTPWHVYDFKQIIISTEPYYAYPVNIVNVSVSDESVLKVEYVGEEFADIWALAVGECTITVETSIGVTKSFTVSVEPHPELEEGVRADVRIDPWTGTYLQFTAEQDGTYNVTFTSDQASYIELGVLVGEDVGDYHQIDMEAGDSATVAVEMKAGQVCLMWLEAFDDTTNVTAQVERAAVQHPDGWAKEDGVWVYYKDGAKVTGWLKDGKDWYYLDDQGAMTIGWVKIGQVWYYMQRSGAMATGWHQIDGNYYYFNNSGLMKTGWLTSGGKRYFFRPSGEMATGWVESGSKWYYMDADGAMVTGTVTIKGVQHKFDGNGVWLGEVTQDGWVKEDGKWYYYQNGTKATGWLKMSGTYYYFDGSGVMQTGWLKSGNTWYYLQSSGAMATGWCKVSGTYYYFSTSGAMQTGWVKSGNSWYYMDASGAMHTGWLKLDGKWYYMNTSGAMVTGTVKIDGVTYKFNSSGVWIP